MRKSIEGFRVCRGAPYINYLLFVEDSLIFCKASSSSSNSLKDLLNSYARALGQSINTEKTTMVFSENMDGVVKSGIMFSWGGSNTQQFKKYFGLPPLVGRSKKKAFPEIKTKLWQRLQVWKEKFLSQEGKRILLKAVTLTISMHAMSCFKLSLTLVIELERLMTKFWWGQKNKEQKIHWISWSNMCNLKSQGGLGFKKSSTFNLALQAKQGCRIHQQAISLLY